MLSITIGLYWEVFLVYKGLITGAVSARTLPYSLSRLQMDKTTILIVDDEPMMLSSMSRILSGKYRVRVANCGKRALEIAASDPRPELVLLDLLMPEMDGFEVLAKLKDDPDTREMSVIFVTAMEGSADEEKGLELGAVDYISKPITPAILLARVKTHLTLKHVRDFLQDKNDYLEAEVARRMEENQAIQDISIRALAHLAETRDPETGEHILRTQNYVQILGRQLQKHQRFTNSISNHYIHMLAKSAPLHDIGKVGIPDQILLKPGKLTKDEFEVMKKHTLFGAQAIEEAERDIEHPVEFLVLAKEIARSHHEHWDGKGYPDGLAGDDIPLSARLMALADVFDALISKRVYKEAMPYDRARSIIIEGRDSHFDPDVTDAFLTCYGQFVQTADKYRDNL
jgi:putative two-component system response regulator